MKVVRGTPKHLSKTGKLDGFTYLMLNLPFQCNFSCQKCFNISNSLKEDSHNFITLEDRIKLIHEAKENGARVVVFAGEGEPLLYPQLDKLLSEVKKLDMISIIYSNGSTLTSDKIDFLIENNSVLVISFDSLDPDKFDLLTRTEGKFLSTLENIKNAIKKYKSKEYSENGFRVLSIALNTTVCSMNEDEVIKIKKFFGDDIYFICNPLAKLGNAVSNWDKLIGKDDKVIQRQQKLIESLSESGGPLTLGKDGLCGYSISGISINPHGDYMTCAYTNKTNGLLGNVKSKCLKEAFEYKRRKEAEQYQKNGAVPCLVRSGFFSKYLEVLKNLGEKQ